MGEPTEMGRQASGVATTGTLNTSSLNIAFMEFLVDADSNMMKKLWLSNGWRDVSPIWGDQEKVPTFKDDQAIIDQWLDFQKQMTNVEADWYYASGHHSRELIADDKDYESKLDCVNQHEYTGFFNEPYHKGRWEHDTRDGDSSLTAAQLYVSSSTDDYTYDIGPQDNPWFSSTRENAKGLFLVGCNTLIYRHARAKWLQFFPNALIIGLMSRESCSINYIMKVIKEYGTGFFTDPASIDGEELCQKLNPVKRGFDNIGVIKDGTLHFRTKTKFTSMDVDEDLEPDHLT